MKFEFILLVCLVSFALEGMAFSAESVRPARTQPKAAIPGIGFVAGTSVKLKEGGKAIDQIHEDDIVWTSDPKSGKSSNQPVASILTATLDAVVELRTTGRDDIKAAPGTLFWVDRKGWVAAQFLFPGEQLLQRDGTLTKVFNVIPERVSQVQVYSLEGKKVRGYFVGQHGVLAGGRPN